MKTDAQLKKDVTAELEWDPAVNATHIGVAVQDGVVTLSGHLDTYAEKSAMERAVQRVAGVHAVAMEVDVRLDPKLSRHDSDIAAAAEAAFRWHTLIPSERIRLKVEKGWVTLTGEVDWEYQRHNAETAIRNLTGVLGVSNAITLKTQPAPANINQRIRDALRRQADEEVKHIEVSVKGSRATLQGTVHSWAERSAAAGAVWAAPGISEVVNELRVAG